MPLIKCNECGRMVSSLASSCPNCGAPITATPDSSNQSNTPEQGYQPYNNQQSYPSGNPYLPQPQKKNGLLWTIVGVAIALIVLLVGYFIFTNERNHREEIEQQQAIQAEQAAKDSIAKAEAAAAEAQAAQKEEEAEAEKEKAKAEAEKVKAKAEAAKEKAKAKKSELKEAASSSVSYSGDPSCPYAYLSTTRLSASDLYGYSSDELCIMRNAIYAMHGRYFKRADLRAYFSQFSWYQPHTWNVSLNSTETHNVSLIKSME